MRSTSRIRGTGGKRNKHRRQQSRRLVLERLDRREMLAALTQIGGASTLNIELDQQDEILEISKSGNTVKLESNHNITGNNLPANLQGVGTKTVTFDQTQLYWLGMNVSDSAQGSSVQFKASDKQYAGSIDIVLDDTNAGGITFVGDTDLEQNLSVTTGGQIIQTSGTLSFGGTTTLNAGLGITMEGTLDLGAKTATFNPGAGQNVELKGGMNVTFDSASDYGMVTSNGSLDLTGASFNYTFNFSPDPGEILRIIDVTDSNDSATGTFAGYPEGETVQHGRDLYRMTYVGGDDANDVELTRTAELMAVGSGEGAAPHVRVYSQAGGKTPVLELHPYADEFLGGVRVATGDVNGDGWDDIVTVPGSGGGPHVKVFSGKDGSVLHNFLAYDPTFTGGLTVAAGDVDGDNLTDIITVAGAGAGPHVKVFSGLDMSELHSFYAFDPGFLGDVTVAVGDVDFDGRDDIVTGAGSGAGPHVRVFDGQNMSVSQSYYAFDPAFQGGVTVAVGDVDGDGIADVVVGCGAGDEPRVKVYDHHGTAILDFLAYDAGFLGGVTVGTIDRDGDGVPDILVGAGPGAKPHLRAFSCVGLNPVAADDFFAFDKEFNGGIIL